MPGFPSSLPFEDSARARANWARLEPRLSAELLTLLPTALAQVPDSDGSLNYLERFTRHASPEVLDLLARQPSLLYHLLALFSHTRFLSESLVQQPELIAWLGRDRQLARIKAKEDLLEEYARFESTLSEADPGVVLTRFKRREYLRITLKDILGLAELTETTLELSILADVLLEKALEVATRELRGRYGQPETRDAEGRVVRGQFAVVGLGKLGGNELNYSSDIDLVFLYAGEGETSGPARIANREYFIRLAQRLLQLIAGVTPEGSVFRVDVRLRPGGGEGDLAVSLPAAIEYYQRQAREWELQMLLKARPVAGTAGLVRTFLQAVEPSLYRTEFDYAVVESVRQAREQMDRKLGSRTGLLNVKLSPGGIRDIEFLAQCLQRLYGQRDAWVRSGGTLVSLQKLHDKAYLGPRDHHRLAAAYQFLRRVEHRLQLENGQQIHTVPADGQALALLARRLGLPARGREAVEMLRKQLDEHMAAVREIYSRVLPQRAGAEGGEGFRLQAPPATSLSGELTYAHLLGWFARHHPAVYASLHSLSVPERARKAFHRFLASTVSSPEGLAALTRRPMVLPAVVELLALSEPLADNLVRHPERLELLWDFSSAPSPPAEQLPLALVTQDSEAAQAVLQELVGGTRAVTERMARLREWYHRQVFRWGVAALGAQRPLWETLSEFSQLAEISLDVAYQMAAEEVGERASQGFAVLALGRLATRELDFGSDADVIFLLEDPLSPAEEAHWRRLAEKLIHVAATYTREGMLFPVDARLRPRGGEGELVQTASSVLGYFVTTAEVWEAATYLKARPVAGDLEFARRWCDRLRAVLAERFGTRDRAAAGLAAMRARMEEEGRKGAAEDTNFKTGPGGVYDIEFVVAAASLAGGALPLGALHLAAQVERLAEAGHLNREETEMLARAALFLRTLDHAIRLATGRPASTPPRTRREAVAVLVGRVLGETISAGELALRLEQTCQQVRRLYQQILGVPTTGLP